MIFVLVSVFNLLKPASSVISIEFFQTVESFNIFCSYTNTDSYSIDKTHHWDINYKSVVRLCNWCNEYNKKLVHISTEFVYANNEKLPTEEDIPSPDHTWYAYTKLLADEYIQLCNSNYLICRELHKPNPFSYDRVWKVQTSGDTVDKISNLIIKLVNKNASGVFNVGTGDKWLKELAPKTSKEIPPPFKTPTDTRMDLTKLNKFLNENNIQNIRCRL